jgi:hypothetical protein
MTPSTLTAEHRYALLVAALTSRPGISVTAPRKKGFGSAALCVNDKIFAMLSSKEQFVVRLPKERVDALVADRHGAYFEPGHGRSMKEWFVAGVGLDESWLSLAEEALSFAGGRVDERSADEGT